MSERKSIDGAVCAFFDQATSSYTYLLHSGGEAALIDPVLGFDPVSGVFDTERADEVVSYISDQGFRLRWILETHVHADHLSAAHYIRARLGGACCIASKISEVQEVFNKVFAFSDSVPSDGSQFDRLLESGERLRLGDEHIEVLATPGHTPACLTYLFRDAAFVGDTVFMPDNGTARTDFPGGDPHRLYRSIHEIFALGDETQIFVCHDYLSEQRAEHRYRSNVAAQRSDNTQIHSGVSEEAYVAMRRTRDAGLAMPRLFYPAVQFNLVAGWLELFDDADDGDKRFFKLPLDASALDP